MKVLHINNYNKRGGAETVFNLTRQVFPAEKNFSGFVYDSTSDEQPDVIFKSWESDGKLKGTINYIFSLHNYQVLKYFLFNNPVDVIHLHGFFSALSPSILLAIKQAKKKSKIKVVQTLHDFHLICPNSSLYNYHRNDLCERCIGLNVKFPIIFENCERRGWIHSLIKAKRSFVANNFLKHKSVIDHLITPSNFLKEKLISDGIPEEKISVIRNPITFNQLENLSVKKKNVICYFGRFSKEKNLSFLINAFTKWKEVTKNDFELLLIGEGEEEELLFQLKNNSSASQSITIKKFLPFDSLAKEIAETKYFCLTSSWFENAPVSIIEAVALNIIPLVPDFGGMKESVVEVCNAGVIYKNGSIESWIDGITKLENNYTSELHKIILARANIFQNYSVEKYVEQLIELYNKE